MRERLENVKEKFREVFGASPEAVVKGPGRVDLLGSHTDYNDGFVLPAAVNVEVVAAGRRRSDNVINVHSTNFNATSTFTTDDIVYDKADTWSNYVRGVLFYLKEAGVELCGMDMVLDGNVPIGSGMSSSAAIEIATGYLFQTILGFEMDGPKLALIGQAAENKFVGVNTGIMDQFISRLGKKDHVLFLDCRSLEYELLPLDTSKTKLVVCDTMKRRGLVGSEYDTRRAQCEDAANQFSQWIPNVTALRDVSAQAYEEHKSKLPEVVRNRAEHVIFENERVLESRKALAAGDFKMFGNLMNQSHDSARDLYEVSCAELEAMVESARSVTGTLGARMAGAGFGGCIVALVEDGAVENFLATVPGDYESRTGLKPNLYVCTAEDGASVLERV